MAGVHSLLEYNYVRDVESLHRLPKGRRQAPAGQPGRRRYRDVQYDEFGLIVESMEDPLTPASPGGQTR
ncbi:MAG: hypothetical protein ACR2FU_16265 [Streptosporangiaceae bacterium]